MNSRDLRKIFDILCQPLWWRLGVNGIFGAAALFFVLRCAFWLSIVYASILWPHGAGAFFGARPDGLHDGRVAGRPAAISVDRVIAGTSDYCTRHAADCLAGAARLASLLEATRLTGVDADLKPGDLASAAAAPLPVRDPRRHGR